MTIVEKVRDQQRKEKKKPLTDSVDRSIDHKKKGRTVRTRAVRRKVGMAQQQ
jgi:hypothetical protein